MQHWEPEVEEGERASSRDLGGAMERGSWKEVGRTRGVGRGDWRGGGMGKPGSPPTSSQGSSGWAGPGHWLADCLGVGLRE